MKLSRITIKKKLLDNKDLTAKETEYVQHNFEPKYENDCGLCRFNVLASLGASLEEAVEACDTMECSESFD